LTAELRCDSRAFAHSTTQDSEFSLLITGNRPGVVAGLPNFLCRLLATGLQ
jgi:hypothetical protein